MSDDDGIGREPIMETVTSRDGTPIAYELAGDGPPIIFATGVFNDHTTCAPAGRAADRRPHGGHVRPARRGAHSGDTAPYAVEREVEDLAALVDLVGGAAAVFGFSSGAVLALQAAADGVPITQLALYEPPFVVGDPARARPADRPRRSPTWSQTGRPGDAVAKFQTEHIGLPPEMVAHDPAVADVAGPGGDRAEHGLRRDHHHRAYAVPSAAMTAVATPTLVLSGADTWPDLRTAAVDLAGRLPAARHVEVAGGENHTIPPEATAAAVREFLR